MREKNVISTFFSLSSTSYLYTGTTTADESSEVNYIVSALITKNVGSYITTLALADKKNSVDITSKQLADITTESLSTLPLTTVSLTTVPLTTESLTSITYHGLNDITSEALTSEALTSEALTSISHTLNDITSPPLTSHTLPSITIEASPDITLHGLTNAPLIKDLIYSDGAETAVTILQDFSKEKIQPSPLIQTTATSW